MTSAQGSRAHIAVGAGIFVGLGLQIGVWSVLVADLATTLRLSPGTLGAALIASTAAGIVAIIVGGSVADRIGRRPVAILGFASACLAFLLFARIETVTGLIGVLMIFGIGGSLIDISANAIGADIERQHETQVMNWLHVGYNVGLALGAGLTVFAFVLDWSYRSIFVLLAVILGAFALAMTRLPMPVPIGRVRAGRAGGDEGRLGYRVLAAPALLLLTGAVIAAYLIDGSFNSFLSLYLRSVFSSGAALAASGVLAVALAGIAGRLIGGGVVRRVGPRRTFLLAAALTLVGLAAAVATESPLVTLIGLLLVAFALAPVVPTALSAVARAAPGSAGRAVGAVGAVGYVALVVGPALVGALADRTSLRFAIGSLMLAAVAIAAGGSIATGTRTHVVDTPDGTLSAMDC
ncbi:MFS transporter [Plantactinospora sp. S1510]|uniref:MFS transporter n=1 Tax=Plantactinospora alkalitolerans TaxID=2789879 RepID=A0ABS0GUS3_9ACTN|nr:MFS transporter [Plantactinospora alkalitolerans]MBF9129657.1 MFS transporter [Plantactinospora alkalitolerans]